MGSVAYDATYYYPIKGVPYLKAAAVHDANDGGLTLFLLNRHLTEECRPRLSEREHAMLVEGNRDRYSSHLIGQPATPYR